MQDPALAEPLPLYEPLVEGESSESVPVPAPESVNTQSLASSSTPAQPPPQYEDVMKEDTI